MHQLAALSRHGGGVDESFLYAVSILQRAEELGFDISRTIHFYEAILATLAIVVWHFYFVIFNPDVYPMNLAWLTGRMSEEEMAEEHPAELARLKALETKPDDETPHRPSP